MRSTWILAALAALATPAVLPAQGAPAAVQPSAAAQRFARAYLPVDRTTEVGRQAFRRTFAGSFDGTPANVALEKRFPGTRAAAQLAGERALATVYAREIPGVQAAIAAEMASGYSAAELEQLSAFIESPAGQAVLAGVAAGPLTGKITEDVKAGRRPTITDADLAAGVDPATIANMPEDQLRAAVAFAATPVAAKFNAGGARLAQLVADRMMAAVQAAQPDMMRAISAAIAAHVGKGK